MAKELVTDELWEVIEPLLPEEPPGNPDQCQELGFFAADEKRPDQANSQRVMDFSNYSLGKF
jgi:transposase